MLAMTVDLEVFSITHVAYITQNVNYITPPCYLNNSRELYNHGVLSLMTVLLSHKFDHVFGLLNKYGLISIKRVRKLKMSCISNIGMYLSYWVTLLNLILIVITHPCIINPGPSKDLTVLYQNVRGFVPFTALGAA